jgi:hypothetical protein
VYVEVIVFSALVAWDCVLVGSEKPWDIWSFTANGLAEGVRDYHVVHHRGLCGVAHRGLARRRPARPRKLEWLFVVRPQAALMLILSEPVDQQHALDFCFASVAQSSCAWAPAMEADLMFPRILE